MPPKSFFPLDQRVNLLTVPSCADHNNAKSSEDVYVLAHVCMNASPNNGAHDVFIRAVEPQLGEKCGPFHQSLALGAVTEENGGVSYKVDVGRLDAFFSALSFGIIFKQSGEQLPLDYICSHIYQDLTHGGETKLERMLRLAASTFYSGEPFDSMNFGSVKAMNQPIYSVKLFGVPGFNSSITVAHEFFGTFRVLSMLSKQ